MQRRRDSELETTKGWKSAIGLSLEKPTDAVCTSLARELCRYCMALRRCHRLMWTESLPATRVEVKLGRTRAPASQCTVDRHLSLDLELLSTHCCSSHLLLKASSRHSSSTSRGRVRRLSVSVVSTIECRGYLPLRVVRWSNLAHYALDPAM